MSVKTNPLRIEDYLETDEDIKEFLAELARTGTYSDLLRGIATAARANGMSNVAKQAGVTRASLYNSLSEDGNPRFETINNVIEALSCKIAIVRSM